MIDRVVNHLGKTMARNILYVWGKAQKWPKISLPSNMLFKARKRIQA